MRGKRESATGSTHKGPVLSQNVLKKLQQVNGTADGAKQEQTNTRSIAHRRSLGLGLVALAPAKAPLRIDYFTWQEKNSGTMCGD